LALLAAMARLAPARAQPSLSRLLPEKGRGVDNLWQAVDLTLKESAP
jgi:hypothetical protein